MMFFHLLARDVTSVDFLELELKGRGQLIININTQSPHSSGNYQNLEPSKDPNKPSVKGKQIVLKYWLSSPI